ncbi:Kelch domain-containing protein 10 [Orchesella cincta]|uniref:Kelch domain-containing protein 10 n=1 Tax=Orchesella cincta TaxID=48709 RepID=A0A1D2NFB0_ORCCI|nr:Kelch domain-containing protein 10 [Orchesella cincta]
MKSLKQIQFRGTMNRPATNQDASPIWNCWRSRQPPRTNEHQLKWNTPRPFSFKPLVFQELRSEPLNTSPFARSPTRVPEPRSGHRVVCDDSNLYSFGGYSQQDDEYLSQPSPINRQDITRTKLFKELWCYNFAKQQWKLLPTTGEVPNEAASHAAILYGNYFVVFGGTGVPFRNSLSNTMRICDLRSLTWKTIETTGEAPNPLYGQAVVLDSRTNSFYVVGGTTGHYFSMDIHKLDLTKRHWETVFVSTGDTSLEPHPRYKHELAYDGENIYVIGGGTGNTAYELKTVPTFNLKEMEWHMLTTKGSLIGLPNDTVSRFPCARKCHGCIQRGDDVFICGGYDSKNIFMDLWRLHIPSMQWHFLTIQMPMALCFHSTCITAVGCMYVFGGVTHLQHSTRTNKLFKIWLVVPKLKEMCWEALLHYRPDICRQRRSSLLKSGIPNEFISRLQLQ